MSAKPKKPGRPALPSSQRRVPLNCRVPRAVLDGFRSRADENETSVGVEVQKAFESSATCGYASRAELARPA